MRVKKPLSLFPPLPLSDTHMNDKVSSGEWTVFGWKVILKVTESQMSLNEPWFKPLFPVHEDENTLYFQFNVSHFYTHAQNTLQTPNTIYCTYLLVQREFRNRVYDSKAIHHADSVKERISLLVHFNFILHLLNFSLYKCIIFFNHINKPY